MFSTSSSSTTTSTDPTPALLSLDDRLDSSTTTTTTAASSEASDPADGEFNQLWKSLVEEESTPIVKVDSALKRTLSGTLVDCISGESVYGSRLSPEVAAERIPPERGGEGGGGLVWNATIIPNAYFVDGKLKKGLNQRDFNIEQQKIKPRRPSLPVTASDFFSSLTRVPSNNGARYIFHGVLNGWPSLRCLELISLEQRRNSSALPTPMELMSGQILWMKTWDAHHEGVRGVEPKIVDQRHVYRARLRGAPWTSKGWSKDSLGFAFWFEAQRKDEPNLSYGTNMLHSVSDATCTYIHMLSHRYAMKRESPKDRLTYHSVCLLEWDHGEYTTVVEAAYLNGIGGYKGRSNWYDDRDAPVSSLYRSMPPEMISPWLTTQAEIRCYDVPAKTLDEFKAYVDKYTGSSARFVDPRFTFSHPARLTFRSKSHIAQYLLNYIARDSSYGELKRNCQTFGADFCCFIAGKKDVVPFHPVNRIDYNNRTHLFLYDSHMYESKTDKKKRKQ